MTKKIVGHPRNQKEELLVLKELQRKRVENVLKLVEWSFDDLKSLKKNLWYCYEEFDSEIAYEKYKQVDEAIQIKEDIEGIPWDMYF